MCSSDLVLGEAFATLGRRDEALAELQAAVALADGLIGPPGRIDARAALGRASYRLGEDDLAERSYREAADLIEAFTSGLAPERAERFRAAPAIADLLKAAS